MWHLQKLKTCITNIFGTEEGGTKVLESLGMVSTGVDSSYLDLSIFPSTSGTLDEDSYAKSSECLQ